MTTSLHRQDDFDSDAVELSQVGSRIRAARQSVGYSIEDLAETCGLTNAEILAIEEGLEFDAAQIKRVAAALQLSTADLLNSEQ